MTKIKRNTKKGKKEEKSVVKSEEGMSEVGESDISINRQLENNAFNGYKEYVKNAVREIS